MMNHCVLIGGRSNAHQAKAFAAYALNDSELFEELAGA